MLLELLSSKLVLLLVKDTYGLAIVEEKLDILQLFDQLNKELVRLVAPTPYLYTVDEVAKALSEKTAWDVL